VADIFLPVQCTPENRAAKCLKETSYDGDTGLVSIAGQQGGEDSGYANGNGSSAFTHRAEEQQP
jgi:hypothetical protein